MLQETSLNAFLFKPCDQHLFPNILSESQPFLPGSSLFSLKYPLGTPLVRYFESDYSMLIYLNVPSMFFNFTLGVSSFLFFLEFLGIPESKD